MFTLLYCYEINSLTISFVGKLKGFIVTIWIDNFVSVPGLHVAECHVLLAAVCTSLNRCISYVEPFYEEWWAISLVKRQNWFSIGLRTRSSKCWLGLKIPQISMQPSILCMCWTNKYNLWRPHLQFTGFNGCAVNISARFQTGSMYWRVRTVLVAKKWTCTRLGGLCYSWSA